MPLLDCLNHDFIKIKKIFKINHQLFQSLELWKSWLKKGRKIPLILKILLKSWFRQKIQKKVLSLQIVLKQERK